MGHDVDTEVEVGCEAPHDRELLVVLLAEHREVGSSGGEQLGDNSGDPVEVAGSRRSLHWFGQPSDMDRGGEPAGIHGSGSRDVHDIDIGGSTDSQVVVDRPRVPVEVALLAELQRIHEDRHDHLVGEPAGRIDQFEMAPMQGAHGGHECDRVTGGASGIRPGAHTGRGVDHGGHPATLLRGRRSTSGPPHGRWTQVDVGGRIADRRRREHCVCARGSEGVGGGSQDQVESALT